MILTGTSSHSLPRLSHELQYARQLLREAEYRLAQGTGSVETVTRRRAQAEACETAYRAEEERVEVKQRIADEDARLAAEALREWFRHQQDAAAEERQRWMAESERRQAEASRRHAEHWDERLREAAREAAFRAREQATGVSGRNGATSRRPVLLALLGLPAGTYSEGELLQARNARVWECHPDRGGSDEELRAVLAAYEELTK